MKGVILDMPKKLLNKSDLKPLPRGFKRMLTKKTYKLPALTLVMMMLALGFSLSDADVVAYAAQNDYAVTTTTSQVQATQSPRWHEQNGVWYLRNEQGTGNTVNSWFQDLDSSWYLLAPGDGHMYAGLIHDTLTDRWYFCQTEHDGWYGRMAHTDGLYTVNGQQVYITFTQEHLGYFGAITSGLESLRATGVVTQDVAGLPTESASAGTPEKKQPQYTESTNGTLSEYDKQFDVNHDGKLDERELINKDFLENHDLNIGQGSGLRDWQ